MNITRFTFCILLAAFISVGCVTHTPDPLADWKPLFGREEEKVDEATKADYQGYIQKLPSKERQFVQGGILLFENGDGKHAVKIEIPYYGVWREHVLIYDKDNKRIKVITYSGGEYRS
jgi:hypothetical protein